MIGIQHHWDDGNCQQLCKNPSCIHFPLMSHWRSTISGLSEAQRHSLNRTVDQASFSARSSEFSLKPQDQVNYVRITAIQIK